MMTPTPKKAISGVTASGMFPFTSLYTLPSTALKTLSDLHLGHGIEGIPDPHYHIHAFTFSNARYRGLHLKLMHMHHLSLQAVRSRSFLLISPAKRDRKKVIHIPAKGVPCLEAEGKRLPFLFRCLTSGLRQRIGIVINKLCTIGEIQKKLFASAFAAIVTRLAHSAIFGERGVSAVAWPADKQRSNQALRFQATVALKSHMGSLTKVSSPFAVIVKTK